MDDSDSEFFFVLSDNDPDYQAAYLSSSESSMDTSSGDTEELTSTSSDSSSDSSMTVSDSTHESGEMSPVSLDSQPSPSLLVPSPPNLESEFETSRDSQATSEPSQHLSEAAIAPPLHNPEGASVLPPHSVETSEPPPHSEEAPLPPPNSEESHVPQAIESLPNSQNQGGKELKKSLSTEEASVRMPEKLSQKAGDEDDGQNCTICFEPWTNYNEHRLVSLRCGHLFGRSCITRWLHSQHSRCPQCNARARKSEIRNLYAKSVKVVDSTELDQARESAKKETELRRKAEFATSQEQLKCMMAVQECERLKKELIEANMLLQEYRSNTKLDTKNLKSAKAQSVFQLEKCMEICKNGGCRIINASDLLGMIIISQPTTNDLFQGYGFRKISTFEMKPTDFVLVHQKPIKDISFHNNDGLVLTASLDKTVKITNVLYNSVVQSYTTPCESWSCAWDTENSNYFYAGLRTGNVLLYDIRVTSQHVDELPRFGFSTPAVTLEYLKNPAGTDKCGPVVGKLSDCGFYQKQREVGKYNLLPIPSLGSLTSISSEPTSGHFLISCRPSSKQPNVIHTVCEIVTKDPETNVVSSLQTVLGGRTQVQLSRSKLLSHPDDPSSLLICAGDEDAHGALIWDCSSGSKIDHMPTESPVLDITGLKISQKSYLLSLTDKNLRLYSWKN